MRELKVGCGKPTGAKVGEKEQAELPGEEPKLSKEVAMSCRKGWSKGSGFRGTCLSGGKIWTG